MAYQGDRGQGQNIGNSGSGELALSQEFPLHPVRTRSSLAIDV